MSITIFPAQPGTFMIERDPSAHPPTVIRVPVIGWNHVQGNMAFPVCVMNHGGLTHGKAILHPEGYVTDSVHGQTFASEAEWMSFMKTAKRGQEEPEEAEDEDRAASMPDNDPEPSDEPENEPDEDVENGEDDANDHAAEGRPIEFGNKSYKSKSFWLLRGSEGHGIGIFEIAGGENYPKDERVTKITRDEMATAKREGVPVIDPTSGEIGDEDDDDGMDLV